VSAGSRKRGKAVTGSASPVARRVRELPPSGIRRFFGLVERMPEAISLSIGEPDFVTPWRIREAAIYSIEKGHTHYTANRGIQRLREEVSAYLSRRFGVEYDPQSELLITVGVSEALDLGLRVLVEPGEGVIVPEPCFVAYVPCALLAGGRPVPVSLRVEEEFKLSGEAVRQAAREGAKVLVISYPSNPTGATMSREELARVAEAARECGLFVISDEIYAELTYDGEHASFAALPGAKEFTLLLGGFSKAFAMTGWRLGYAAGPAEVIEAMTKVHTYTLMCSPTGAQEAAVEALEAGWGEVARMREEYDQRRRVVVKRLNEMGLSCFEPKGAFYAFPSIRATGMSSEEFCERLLEKEKVAVVPGTAFGSAGEGYVRCSYATGMAQLEEALARMARFVGRRRGRGKK
jgi:aminotransferase